MTLKARHIVNPDQVSTADAITSTVIASYDLATPGWDNCSVSAVARFIGRNTSNGDSVHCTVAQSYKRVSGTLTLDGAMITSAALGGVAGLLTSVPVFAASGTTIQAKVTGVAATTISWMCWLELYVNGA